MGLYSLSIARAIKRGSAALGDLRKESTHVDAPYYQIGPTETSNRALSGLMVYGEVSKSP
jgi:hypothetical protein